MVGITRASPDQQHVSKAVMTVLVAGLVVQSAAEVTAAPPWNYQPWKPIRSVTKTVHE